MDSPSGAAANDGFGAVLKAERRHRRLRTVYAGPPGLAETHDDAAHIDMAELRQPRRDVGA
jgi:hypothetical protein